MKEDQKTVKTKKGIKAYTYLGCPLTRNRSAWCYRLCIPDDGGSGRCGRVAPHSIKSKTQLAIEKHKKKQLRIHFGKLENMYLSSPDNTYYSPGIKITAGEADIVIPIQKKFYHTAGSVHNSVYFKAMVDSAFLAVNSITDSALVMMTNFNTYLTRPIQSGELLAKGRFMCVSGDFYLAESVLTDSEGIEICRGNGAFVKSDITLSSSIGYK